VKSAVFILMNDDSYWPN